MSRETSGTTTFSVSVANLAATGLGKLDGPLYLKLDFDSFKKFTTERLTAASEVQWEQGSTFYYRTKFPNRLRRKSFSVQLWDANRLQSDKLLGEVKVDLHTLATGPRKHDLVVRDAGKPVGHLLFDLGMEELGTDLTVIFANVRAAGPPASFSVPAGAEQLTPSFEHCFSLTADRRELSEPSALDAGAAKSDEESEVLFTGSADCRIKQ